MSVSDTIDSSISEHFAALSSKIDAVVSRPRVDQAYLTIDDAADYSGLSAESIRKMVNRGAVKAYRPVPGRLLIAKTELDNAIRSSTSTPRKRRGVRAN